MRKSLFASGAYFASLILGGCASIEGIRPDIAARPVPSRLDEVAYINTVRSAFLFVPEGEAGPRGESSLGCYNGTGLRPFRTASAEGYTRGTPEEEIYTTSEAVNYCIFFRRLPEDEDAARRDLTEYLSAGFGLTDLYCQRFFTVVTASAQNRRFGRSVTNGVDALVGSILTLSGVGRTAIGITNSGFSMIDATFQAYDDAYLVAPDMANVRRLVLAAQNEFRQQVLGADGGAGLPGSYETARSTIERYSGLCTFAGMRQMVNDSIADATDDIEDRTNAAENPPEEPETPSETPDPEQPAAPEASEPATRPEETPAVPPPPG